MCFFWHLTDLHYDPLYTTQGDIRRQCRKFDPYDSPGYHRELGKFGDYLCYSPYELIESAVRFMKTKNLENVEFILWTGDIITSHYDKKHDQYQAIKKITDLLNRSFSSHFIFPFLGHSDPPPSENLTRIWMQWLPSEALQTFETGGYYTIEQTHTKLRIVALNTNLFSVRGMNDIQASKQWEWLESVLDKATVRKEMVYIVGHEAPGVDDHHGHDFYSLEVNIKYQKIIKKYAQIIAGQFFGHSHADTFRVIYDNDRPVSWALLAPSLSPYNEQTGSSNPGIRQYKFDTYTGKILDYAQYYLDLTKANRAGNAEWQVEYNFTQYYGLHDISSQSLHKLADKLRTGTQHETFNKYMKAYKVKYDLNHLCEEKCAYRQYCAITCLDQIAYRHCAEAAASALASASARHSVPLSASFAYGLLFLYLYI